MAAKKTAGIGSILFPASTNPETLQYHDLHKQLHGAVDARWNAQHGADIGKMLGAGLGLGVGGMALYHLIRGLKTPGSKEKRYQNMASGAPMPVAKAASDSLSAFGSNLLKNIGQLPDTVASAARPGNVDPDMIRGSLATVGGLGAGLLGLYGGGKLVNKIVDNKNKADADDEVEAARKRYYAILSGQDKAAAALDAVYEKAAADGWLQSLYHTATDTVPRTALTGTLLASLAAGGLGANYMYNRTAERTRGENLAKAQASRARMKALPAVYIDPEQLAQVKQLAEQKPHE